jgi:hypothetical protein
MLFSYLEHHYMMPSITTYNKQKYTVYFLFIITFFSTKIYTNKILHFYYWTYIGMSYTHKFLKSVIFFSLVDNYYFFFMILVHLAKCQVNFCHHWASCDTPTFHSPFEDGKSNCSSYDCSWNTAHSPLIQN